MRARAIKLSDLDLDPVETIETIVRYEHEAPGDLLHIDIKKLGRIERLGQRVTGNRRDIVEGAGCECLFVAIDDHAHIGFTDMYRDEQRLSAIQFLRNAVAYYASLGIKVKRLLTDDGPLSALATSPELASIQVLVTSSPAFTGRRPTARPNASSRTPCANGLTGLPTNVRWSVPMPWTLGSTIQLAPSTPRHRRNRTHG